MKVSVAASLEKIRDEKFPIIVTADLPKEELAGWQEHFRVQGVKCRLFKVNRVDWQKKELYNLRRKVTEKEIEEIRGGLLNIVGNGFQKNDAIGVSR